MVVLHVFLIVTTTSTCLPQVESSEKLSSFDDAVVDRLESEFEQMNTNERSALIHKIGVLGVYFRIYKKLVPVAGGETGYLYRFPEPFPDLDTKLKKICEAGLSECISEILSTVQSSHSWLYPTKTQGRYETELSSATLKDVISDNLLTTEITATQGRHQIQHCNIFRFVDTTCRTMHKGKQNFCPDPCCHGVQPSSPLLLSRECAFNKCIRKDRCSIEAAFNDDFNSMRVNKWNITCPCGKGLMYRSDVEACVHSDLCSEHQRCPPTFDCINTIADPGFRCICQLGYIMNDMGRCDPIAMSSSAWHGFAYSEPHPQLSSTNLLLLEILLPMGLYFS